MASEFLNIPGNIKQLYLPFVLDPSNPALSIPIKYENSANGADHLAVETSGWTQYFSFSPHKIEASGEACSIDGTTYDDIKNGGLLHIAPYSLYHKEFLAVNDDISYSLLYNQHLNDSLKISDILDSIPSIEIREYLQDAKLNMVFDLFQPFGNGMSDGLTSGENDRNNGEYNPFKNLSEFGKKVWNFIKAITSNFGEIMTASASPYMTSIDSEFDTLLDDNSTSSYVMKFPYMLYYRLMSTTTTNIYNIPYNGSVLYESQGGGFSKGGLGGLTADGKSIFGQFVNWFGKNIRINTTPTWDGPQDVPTKVDIDFSLYNDSLDGALKNFIFVNTIVPNNKWIQYHCFQHAPCLYDIKINGINRLFMCQGEFKVESKGTLRRPSDLFLEILSGKFTNDKFGMLSDDLKANDIIRIPDIYDVHMTFTSLLPNNFNNFLFANYANKHIPELLVGTEMRQDSFLNPIASELGNIIKDVWTKTNSDYGPIITTNNGKIEVTRQMTASSNQVDNTSNLQGQQQQYDINNTGIT